MQLFLAAAAGGALGAGARFLVNVACTQLLGPVFPWATLTVNVVGSFLMGLVVGFSGLLLGGSSVLRTFLATGILGGFTTFSAFSLDVVQLVERRQHALAALYISASVVISIAALWAGLTAARVSLR
jgi:fluoride exporter